MYKVLFLEMWDSSWGGSKPVVWTDAQTRSLQFGRGADPEKLTVVLPVKWTGPPPSSALAVGDKLWEFLAGFHM